jgi:hypothetical protein
MEEPDIFVENEDATLWIRCRSCCFAYGKVADKGYRIIWDARPVFGRPTNLTAIRAVDDFEFEVKVFDIVGEGEEPRCRWIMNLKLIFEVASLRSVHVFAESTKMYGKFDDKDVESECI